jgi:hypothetical protein
MHVKSPVSMYLLGSDCKPTLDGIIIYRNAKKNQYETIFSPESFKQDDGTKITSKQVKDLLYSDGDGVVTKRSLLTSTSPFARARNGGYRTALFVNNVSFACEAHNQLTGNPDVQTKLFDSLVDKMKAAVSDKK